MYLKIYMFFSMFFVAQLASASAENNFVLGTLGLENGETIECEFVLRIKSGKDGTFNMDHKRLKYRMPGNLEVQRMDYDDLSFIEVNTKETKILLRRLHYYTMKENGTKKSKDKAWCQYKSGCDKLQGYLLIQEFALDGNGEVWESYLDDMGWYLLLKEGEEEPSHVGMVFRRKIMTQKAFDRQRRRLLEKYFKGDEDGLAFIKGKKIVTEKELKDYVSNRCGG